MPGKNCCLPGCCVSETPKYDGIKLYRITTRKDSFYSKWREDILAVVKRYRVFDGVFLRRIQNGRAFICDRHYNKEKDFEKTSEFFSEFCLFSSVSDFWRTNVLGFT